MALHEAGGRMVCGTVLDLQDGEGQTLEASWKGPSATHSHVEMGRDHHGIQHEVTEDSEGRGFHLGHYG